MKVDLLSCDCSSWLHTGRWTGIWWWNPAVSTSKTSSIFRRKASWRVVKCPMRRPRRRRLEPYQIFPISRRWIMVMTPGIIRMQDGYKITQPTLCTIHVRFMPIVCSFFLIFYVVHIKMWEKSTFRKLKFDMYLLKLEKKYCVWRYPVVEL